MNKRTAQHVADPSQFPTNSSSETEVADHKISHAELQLHEPLNAEDRPQEECGVFGIYAPGIDVARRTFFGIFALQHRGQESAGIAVSNGQELHIHKEMGLVTQVFDNESIERLVGDLAIGHTRYSISSSSTLANALPLIFESSDGPTAVSHNGSLVNTDKLQAELAMEGVEFFTGMDTEVIAKMLETLQHLPIEEALLEMMRRVKGAYTLVFMTRDTIIALRDPHGVRPLCLGKMTDGSGWVVASETCALPVAGADFVREIEPGEILFINKDGLESVFYKEEPAEPQSRPALCVFEFIYLARPDSQLLGENIHHARRRMGEELARQSPVEADIVIGVPDSGTPAAIGYASASGIPFQEGLIKNRYIQRTFIQPDQAQREMGVRMKLTPLNDVLRGKRVVVVEDSIVRGTTTRRIVQMLRDAGAKEVHLRISSPPYRWPCFFGIDTAVRTDLIAYNKTVEEIRAHNGADSLSYLSMDNLLKAIGQPKQRFCRACFDGEYPIRIPPKVKVAKHVFEGESSNGQPGDLEAKAQLRLELVSSS